MHRVDNLTTLMCRVSRNQGKLKLVEKSGPVQVCNGIALLRIMASNKGRWSCNIVFRGNLIDAHKNLLLKNFTKLLFVRKDRKVVETIMMGVVGYELTSRSRFSWFTMGQTVLLLK